MRHAKNTITGVCCMLYAVWWFPTAVRIRLSQPPAGDWLAGAWAELGKNDNSQISTTTNGNKPPLSLTKCNIVLVTLHWLIL